MAGYEQCEPHTFGGVQTNLTQPLQNLHILMAGYKHNIFSTAGRSGQKDDCVGPQDNSVGTKAHQGPLTEALMKVTEGMDILVNINKLSSD